VHGIVHGRVVRSYDLRCAQNAVHINPYNPSIMTLWDGNMDLQFVGDKSMRTAMFV